MAITNFIYGTNGDDAVWNGGTALGGTDQNDAIYGYDGDDDLFGNDGDDFLSGGKGQDRLFGGKGNDVINGGDDDDLIYGEDGDDQIEGGAGNDTIYGGTGKDKIYGGTGSDIYHINSDEGDEVIEYANAGLDHVFVTGASYTLTANVERGSAQKAGMTLNGNDLDNHLWGTTGAETLRGGGGNDMIDGGAGADKMFGGTGDDTFFVDNAGDVVTEYLNEGIDTVYSSLANYTLGLHVENLVRSSNLGGALTGNYLANVITGGNGGDVIDGKTGADTMIGRGGDDVYYVDDEGDVVVEKANEGIDRVYSTAASTTLSANVEYLYLTGTTGQTGTGNDLSNVIVGSMADDILAGGLGDDQIQGGAGHDTIDGGEGKDFLSGHIGNDTLLGGAGDDGLDGGEGDDRLDGGAGADWMAGGLGDDIFIVDDVLDVVYEGAGEGYDTVRSSVSFAIGDADIEKLVLTGTKAINGTGNALANTIIGNAKGNVIDGGAGADVMEGKGGDDTYRVDDAGDKVIEVADGGIDTVVASVSHTLSANVENLTLSGSEAIDGTGNVLANTIIGNAAANVLNGKAGADVMKGRGGDDTYHVDNVGDQVVEGKNAGIDTVIATVSHTLALNVENLVLSGSKPIDGTGNALDNVLVGNGKANILDAKEGSDILTGGAGADQFVFSTTLGADNVDTITDFQAGLDTIVLDASIFAAPGAGLGSGEFRANVGGIAKDANDFILYDTATGALSYDADGNGAGAAVQFAQLGTGLALTASGFLIL